MFEGICEALHNELEDLNDKFADGEKMNAQELEHIDKMAHALKSLATYEAMLEGSGAYARNRSRNTWRYGGDRRY